MLHLGPSPFLGWGRKWDLSQSLLASCFRLRASCLIKQQWRRGGSWGAGMQTLPLTCLLSQGPYPGCPHPAPRPSPCQGAAFHHLATLLPWCVSKATTLRKQRGSVPGARLPRVPIPMVNQGIKVRWKPTNTGVPDDPWMMVCRGEF